MYNDEHNLYHYTYRKDGSEAEAHSAPQPGPVQDHNSGPQQPVQEMKPVKKNRIGLKVTALALCCALLGGAVGGGIVWGVGRSGDETSVNVSGRTVSQVALKTVDGKTAMSDAEVYAANVNSVVSINVTGTNSNNFFGQPVQTASSGSGFILTTDGYIVTNYHVVGDAQTIQVTLYSGDTYDAQYVGGDEDYDIAVIKIEATGLQAVTLGDSDQLVVGESVYTIGNPLGELTYSLSDGLVSALDRLITTSGTNPVTNQKETITLNVLQTNCAINPGNSGGPLFDSYGNVVGVVNAKYTETSSGVSAEGLGFALPINDLKDIIEEIIEYGYVTGKPYLGIQVNVVDEQMQAYGIPAGAVVEYVADGSCAQKGGLQVNDIITAIDDTAVDSPSALTAALSSNYKAGDTITLTVVRNLEEIKLTITLDEKNDQTESANQIQDQSNQQNNYQGSYNWPFGSFFW